MGGAGGEGADDVRPFDPQLHFIYECESCNFFLSSEIYLYI